MYILNSTITLNWYLITGDSPPLLANLDIVITKPDGTTQYLSSVINADDYIPSTINSKGAVSYDITPNIEGVWSISLVTGIPSTYTVYGTHELTIHDSDRNIVKFVKESLL